MESTLSPLPQSTLSLSPSTPETLAKVDAFQAWLSGIEQVEIRTEHVLHGGMYARTIRLNPDVIVVGSLMKIPTLLVVVGDVDVFTGNDWTAISGYEVLPGSAGRKQVVVTRSEVRFTMIFPTQARTVEEAEREFTDECDSLMSRKSKVDSVTVTGE